MIFTTSHSGVVIAANNIQHMDHIVRMKFSKEANIYIWYFLYEVSYLFFHILVCFEEAKQPGVKIWVGECLPRN